MNLRNNSVRRSFNRKGPQCWVFRFPLDSLWLWYWALPFFQWHRQQGMQLYWEERFWLDWEQLKLSWGLEASEPTVAPEGHQGLAWLVSLSWFLQSTKKPPPRERSSWPNNPHHSATTTCKSWCWNSTAITAYVVFSCRFVFAISKEQARYWAVSTCSLPIAFEWLSMKHSHHPACRLRQFFVLRHQRQRGWVLITWALKNPCHRRALIQYEVIQKGFPILVSARLKTGWLPLPHRWHSLSQWRETYLRNRLSSLIVKCSSRLLR